MSPDRLFAVAVGLKAGQCGNVYCRLNVRQGPNERQMLQHAPRNDDGNMTEFDLFYFDLEKRAVDGMWVDIIFEAPFSGPLVIGGLSFTRSFRAGF